MYNVWHEGPYQNYPMEGAPMGLYLSSVYPRLCNVCWALFQVLNRNESEYWKKIHDEEDKKQKRLGRGGNYLTS